MLGRALTGAALAATVVTSLALAGCSAGTTGAAGAAAQAVSASVAVTAPAEAPATPSPTPTAAPAPKVTHATVTSTVEIPFGTDTTDDPSRAVGESAVVAAGRNGTKTQVWDVASLDGVETGRTLVSESTTAEPVTEVTAVGTKQPAPAPVPVAEDQAADEQSGGAGCDPNYEGACVPIDSDVDCAGGKGNGPSYVEGPVRVVGEDIYGLDGNDNDGIGCE